MYRLVPPIWPPIPPPPVRQPHVANEDSDGRQSGEVYPPKTPATSAGAERGILGHATPELALDPQNESATPPSIVKRAKRGRRRRFSTAIAPQGKKRKRAEQMKLVQDAIDRRMAGSRSEEEEEIFDTIYVAGGVITHHQKAAWNSGSHTSTDQAQQTAVTPVPEPISRPEEEARVKRRKVSTPTGKSLQSTKTPQHYESTTRQSSLRSFVTATPPRITADDANLSVPINPPNEEDDQSVDGGKEVDHPSATINSEISEEHTKFPQLNLKSSVPDSPKDSAQLRENRKPAQTKTQKGKEQSERPTTAEEAKILTNTKGSILLQSVGSLVESTAAVENSPTIAPIQTIDKEGNIHMGEAKSESSKSPKPERTIVEMQGRDLVEKMSFSIFKFPDKSKTYYMSGGDIYDGEMGRISWTKLQFIIKERWGAADTTQIALLNWSFRIKTQDDLDRYISKILKHGREDHEIVVCKLIRGKLIPADVRKTIHRLEDQDQGFWKGKHRNNDKAPPPIPQLEVEQSLDPKVDLENTAPPADPVTPPLRKQTRRSSIRESSKISTGPTTDPVTPCSKGISPRQSGNKWKFLITPEGSKLVKEAANSSKIISKMVSPQPSVVKGAGLEPPEPAVIEPPIADVTVSPASKLAGLEISEPVVSANVAAFSPAEAPKPTETPKKTPGGMRKKSPLQADKNVTPKGTESSRNTPEANSPILPVTPTPLSNITPDKSTQNLLKPYPWMSAFRAVKADGLNDVSSSPLQPQPQFQPRPQSQPKSQVEDEGGGSDTAVRTPVKQQAKPKTPSGTKSSTKALATPGTTLDAASRAAVGDASPSTRPAEARAARDSKKSQEPVEATHRPKSAQSTPESNIAQSDANTQDALTLLAGIAVISKEKTVGASPIPTPMDIDTPPPSDSEVLVKVVGPTPEVARLPDTAETVVPPAPSDSTGLANGLPAELVTELAVELPTELSTELVPTGSKDAAASTGIFSSSDSTKSALAASGDATATLDTPAVSSPSDPTKSALTSYNDATATTTAFATATATSGASPVPVAAIPTPPKPLTLSTAVLVTPEIATSQSNGTIQSTEPIRTPVSMPSSINSSFTSASHDPLPPSIETTSDISTTTSPVDSATSQIDMSNIDADADILLAAAGFTYKPPIPIDAPLSKSKAAVPQVQKRTRPARAKKIAAVPKAKAVKKKGVGISKSGKSSKSDKATNSLIVKLKISSAVSAASAASSPAASSPATTQQPSPTSIQKITPTIPIQTEVMTQTGQPVLEIQQNPVPPPPPPPPPRPSTPTATQSTSAAHSSGFSPVNITNGKATPSTPQPYQHPDLSSFTRRPIADITPLRPLAYMPKPTTNSQRPTTAPTSAHAPGELQRPPAFSRPSSSSVNSGPNAAVVPLVKPGNFLYFSPSEKPRTLSRSGSARNLGLPTLERTTSPITPLRQLPSPLPPLLPGALKPSEMLFTLHRESNPSVELRLRGSDVVLHTAPTKLSWELLYAAINRDMGFEDFGEALVVNWLHIVEDQETLEQHMTDYKRENEVAIVVVDTATGRPTSREVLEKMKRERRKVREALEKEE